MAQDPCCTADAFQTAKFDAKNVCGRALLSRMTLPFLWVSFNRFFLTASFVISVIVDNSGTYQSFCEAAVAVAATHNQQFIFNPNSIGSMWPLPRFYLHFSLVVMNRFRNGFISLPFCKVSTMEIRLSECLCVNSCGTQTSSFFFCRQPAFLGGSKLFGDGSLAPRRYHGYSCVVLAWLSLWFYQLYFPNNKSLQGAS